MTGWEVRDARPGDAPVLGWIHVEAWRAAYQGIVDPAFLAALDPGRRGRDWLRWLAEPGDTRSLVVERLDDGALLGMATVGPYRPNPDGDADRLAGSGAGELHLLYLDPQAWGTGAGDALLAAAHEALASSGFDPWALWVFEGNPRARRFYERHGWRDDGTRLAFALGTAQVVEARYRRSGPA